MNECFVMYSEDEKGDLLNVEHFDTHGCLINSLGIAGIFSRKQRGGQKTPDTEMRLVWSIAPCKEEEVEYPLYCGWCGWPMNELAHHQETKV